MQRPAAMEVDPHERIFRETGMPNPMVRGDAGASRWAYPDGLPRERFARSLRRLVRAIRRRGGER